MSNRFSQVTDDSWRRQWFGIDHKPRDTARFTNLQLQHIERPEEIEKKPSSPPFERIWLKHGDKEDAGTNELAGHLNVKPATANDMLKKLKGKKLVDYKKYGKSSLTQEGRKLAVEVVRKHRLWETFLCQKLDFTWDEVHEVAEQLEHIRL